MDFNRRLEPRGRAVWHGAGQSADAFGDYVRALPETPPALYMTYVGLRRDLAEYFARLQGQLAAYPDLSLVPQIGLSMTKDGSPEQHYEQEVAAGKFDAQIERFCTGLVELGRPAFVRIGYEFNGHWNGYEPATFKAAWVRITAALRRHALEKVATVWCYAPDGQDKDFLRFYPGDEFVDWWGIDLFSVAHFAAADTVAFMDAAQTRRYPVMIGESTPRFVGVQEGAASWEQWFTNYFTFIRAWPHCKAFCYINWNWAEYRQWADWGDGRITANAEVLARYREELRDSLYRGRVA